VRVVLDTNVIIAALRSRNGASYLLLDFVDRGTLQLILNAALIEEYEDVARRPPHRRVHKLSDENLLRFLRGLISAAEIVETPFDRRVILARDPSDAVVAEAAIEGKADYLVTYNLRHFIEVADRIPVVTPAELLRKILT
jgi:putative PIN family toxin of toxin-antitoxin system